MQEPATVDCRTDRDWRAHTLASLHEAGYAVVQGVLDADAIEATEKALHRVARLIDDELGAHVRASHGDACLLRLMMKYDAHFLALLQNGEMLSIVDGYLSASAVLRYQAGVIYTPRTPPALRPPNGDFHQNFPHLEAKSPIALDVALLVSDMTRKSAPLFAVPGSHRLVDEPDEASMAGAEVPLSAPAGSMILIDGSLWHREGVIESEPGLFVSQQFTHPLVKPHFDYPRALGEDVMTSLSERCRHLLGWNFRLPAGLDDFYKNEGERLFDTNKLQRRAGFE